jgi:hypothetical protein
MTSPDLERTLAQVFAPLDKRAFGLALGVATALLVAAITSISLLRDPEQIFPLGLLGQLFFGYSVTWPGMLVGAAWGFLAGFFWGWFFAFCRNLALAFWLMTVRVRADFSASGSFLDHV